MLYVERQDHIPSASTDGIIALLFNPHTLQTLLPRLRKAEARTMQDNMLPMTLTLSIGKLFGTVHIQGYLWQASPHEVVFHIPGRTPSEIRWTLVPDAHGVSMQVRVQLHLHNLLGPMAHFLPQSFIEEIIGSEMAHAFRGVSAHFEHAPEHQMCPMPQLCPVAPAPAYSQTMATAMA